ncbi:hypothetical protein CBG04_10005 [Limosilactobacillus reuteri]|uniref:Uncharacterized protein n=1 Tax=Limosilactobacillus reuteri TaxID=1598 RepID=A0A073JNE4_LIMRT|nr:hypothetical protein [Limosilactobacillus reuteri]KEK16112.1 hypothetical protein LR3_08585 [Limosilactobacillus reuteri]MCR1877994.1 hypothetical protein [Limosilactobacillus reuteri]OYS80598.1 hypothetical protein CBG11_07185 [Limosilactobacillus reuteri]OYS81417.1 hypothetical protein CBG04_10005 [Limosilactobacillus reuteri]OYS83736.1 hypothetical protein CBG14_07355 [Limosilactobacillus reuteri]
MRFWLLRGNPLYFEEHKSWHGWYGWYQFNHGHILLKNDLEAVKYGFFFSETERSKAINRGSGIENWFNKDADEITPKEAEYCTKNSSWEFIDSKGRIWNYKSGWHEDMDIFLKEHFGGSLNV